MSVKEAFQKKLQAQLDEWETEINKLKARADKAGAEARLEYYKHVESLQAKHKAAKRKLDEFKETGDDAWEDLKDGMENAWSDLSNGVKSVMSRFK